MRLNIYIKILWQQVKLFIHKGNKYTCPFCNYSSKDLSQIGNDFPVLIEKQVIGGGKRSAGCYKCKSDDRERLIYLFLKEKIKLFESDNEKNILHIAPEINLSKKIIDHRFKQYVCGDLFTSERYEYPTYVESIDILNITYSDNSFDLIICSHVLEHIPNDLDAMKELYRVLKVGGLAILQVPISKNSSCTIENFSIKNPKQRELYFGQYDHVRIYGQDYISRLKESGFKATRINISDEYTNAGLNKDEDIFICEK